MLFRILFSVGVLLAGAAPLRAQAPPVDGPDRIVSQLEDVLRSGSSTELDQLISSNVAINLTELRRFSQEFLTSGVRRAVARERDRVPLQGALPGDGYSLVVEFFVEIADHAQMMTARVDVRRPRGGDVSSWRIVDVERLSLVEGLYRLRLNTSRQLAATNFTLQAEDLQLTLRSGTAFLVESDNGITGMVLLGRGEMRFSPPSATEKGQLRIFNGSDSFASEFDSAFVRFNPDDYMEQITTGLVEQRIDPSVVRRAQETFDREGPKSFNLDLSDMSPEQWFLIPQPRDFLADVRTRRHGTLTYSRNQNQAEDVTLFNRERRRTISLYPSVSQIASRGATYNEDDLTDYDILAYDIEANIDPDRAWVDGRARITLRSRSSYLATLTLRLADTLNVTNIASPQFGRLLFLRVRNQNGVLVNLPSAIGEGAEITLVVTYSGRVEPQRVDSEGLALGQDLIVSESEPSYLLSNRSYWYPQNSVNDFASARLRVSVPSGYGVVASGQQVVGSDNTTLRDLLGPVGSGGRTLTFTATDPLRYLSVIVSRFSRVADTTIASRPRDPAAAPNTTDGRRSTVALAVEANPRQQGRGREVASVAEDVMRFYSTLMDDTPYPSMTIAVVERELPGGHSPAYATVINNPPPSTQFLWSNDPAAFINYPEFFVAHELAHQWWGQAVGWKNYHEQWISEGFAQYFSALYAQKARGDGAFGDMLRQFRRWAMSESDEGPVYLGYRLGHIKGDSRVLRALIYNKGAAVLHMLRRLVGDERFFRGLRRFYNEQRFKKAGTDDFQRAMEAETGMDLDRFFQQWIYGAELPRVRYSTQVTDTEAIVRFEQLNEELFDLPVTVTVVHANGRTTDVVVPLTQQRLEQRIPVERGVRQIQVNRDNAALATFNED